MVLNKLHNDTSTYRFGQFCSGSSNLYLSFHPFLWESLHLVHYVMQSGTFNPRSIQQNGLNI